MPRPEPERKPMLTYPLRKHRCDEGNDSRQGMRLPHRYTFGHHSSHLHRQ